MGELSFNNILGEDEINLFIEDEDTTTEESVDETTAGDESSDSDGKKNEKETTTEVDPEDLFEEGKKRSSQRA